MNVLGICGSPRAAGNSQLLLEHALAPFEDEGWSVAKVLLCEKSIAPCLGCDCCEGSSLCVRNDDMRNIYARLEECDALIVSSPVYYRNVSATLAALLERCYAVRAKHPLSGKPGGAIAVGRGTCGGQAIVIDIVYNWMRSCGMICVSGELNGVTAVADRPGDVLSQPQRLAQAAILGKNILGVARRLARHA